MNLKRKQTSNSRIKRGQRGAGESAVAVKAVESHILFFPILILSLVFWFLYRRLFAFPVWFDETIGKAVFLGLPVWLYIVTSRSRSVIKSFSFEKMQTGLLLGLAVGGVFGFVTAIMAIIQKGGLVEAVPLFVSNQFWYEFVLAIFTGFWETLFFFSFVMTVIIEKYRHSPLFQQLLLVAGIFIIFHVPNAFIRFSPWAAVAQIFLLTLFALGQALLFYGRRNAYALVLSQAIWGMVLLVYGW
ncbi:hypothetical protein KKF92_01160 [Patescibacteria group bacterium]|nr:hypothetical protein [Patescibacteria group bacterium]